MKPGGKTVFRLIRSSKGALTDQFVLKTIHPSNHSPKLEACPPPEDITRQLNSTIQTDHNSLLNMVNSQMKSTNQSAALCTTASLLSQPEFVALYNYQHSKFTSSLEGVCGHIYATQYLPTDYSIKTSELIQALPFHPVGKP